MFINCPSKTLKNHPVTQNQQKIAMPQKNCYASQNQRKNRSAFQNQQKNRSASQNQVKNRPAPQNQQKSHHMQFKSRKKSPCQTKIAEKSIPYISSIKFVHTYLPLPTIKFASTHNKNRIHIKNSP